MWIRCDHAFIRAESIEEIHAESSSPYPVTVTTTGGYGATVVYATSEADAISKLADIAALIDSANQGISY